MITVTTPPRDALVGCSVSQLRTCLSESKRARAALDAVDLQIIALLEESTSASGSPVRTVPEIELVAHGGRTRREADEAVRRAHIVDDAPCLGDALASGTVTTAHIDVIRRGLHIAGEAKDAFLALVPGLLESASDMTVPEFHCAVIRAAKGLVTDGGLSIFEEQRRSTYLKIWNDANGMTQMRGAFDPEIGALIQSRLQARVETMFHSGDRDVALAHHPWIDANDCRRAHALAAALSTSGSATTCRSDVVVHVDLHTLQVGLHASSTHTTNLGADLPVDTIRRLACEANIIPLVLDGAGMPLDIGRSQRLASAHQRRALEGAHPTCAMPECQAPFHHCQIHHIDYWEHGGATDLSNMVPLCSRHHHAAHEGGWTIALEPGTRTLLAQPPP